MKIPRVLSCAAGTALLFGAAANSYADYATEVLGQQPITYWRFNENVTTPVLYDAAANLGSLGAAGSGLYYDVYTRPTAGALAGDSAVAFVNPTLGTGYTGSMRVTNNPALNPNGPFSVEFWAKASNNTAALLSPVNSMSLSIGRMGYLFYQNAAVWQFRVGVTTNTTASVLDGGAVVPGQWQHVVGVFTPTTLPAGTMTLYVDGVQVGTAAGLYEPNTNATFCVGSTSSPNRTFDGAVDEVAFFNGALSASQVAAHFAARTTNATGYAAQILADAPVGYWRLNDPAAYPVAVNAGSRGAAANGSYVIATTTTGPSGASFPGLEANNRAVAFDGTNTYVIASGLGLRGPLTVSAWVNPNALSGDRAIASENTSWAFKLLDSNLRFTTPGILDHNSGAANLQIGTWQNVAVTFVPGTTAGAEFFVNGQSVGTADASALTQVTSIFWMGKNQWAGQVFNGAIDEVAVFDRALLTGQIRTLYLTAIGDVNPPAFVSDMPIVSPAGTIYTTTPFTLSINVYGAGPLTYQWRKNGTVVGTSRDYTVSAASLTDSGSYDVIVSNAHGSVTSAAITITIDPAVPPTIDQQPVARSVFPGGDARFTVSASGTTPFTYQWKKGGVNITGATNQTLVLTNLTSADVATYTVGVSNVAGGVVSAGAALTIATLVPGSFLEAVVTNRPINYWRLGETTGTNAFDSMGRLDGTYGTGVTLGMAGGVPLGGTDTAVQFDGTINGQVTFGGDNIQPPWTAVFWVKRPDQVVASSALLDGPNTSLRLEQWQNTAHVGFTAYGVADYEYGYTAPAETWVQLVFVGKTGSTDLYVNGAFVESSAASIALPRRSIGGGDVLIGQLDEVALYGYDLSADAIAQMYSAGVFGPAIPPTIDQQPVSRSVYPGGRASFTVAASGSFPLRYQWQHAGTNLPGATDATLVLTGCTAAQAGAYTVGVTNMAGGRLSATATLTLLTPAANTFEAAVVALGPVAYWRLNEATGTTTAEYAGGHDGAVMRNVTMGTAGPASPTYPGLEAGNRAFAFDGTDAYVEASSLGLAGPLSVAAWVKPNAFAADRAIAGESASWAFKLLGNEIRFTTPGLLDHDSVGAALVANEWQHVAVTFAPGTADGAKFYLNGRQLNSTTASALNRGSSLFWIGKNQWGQVFDGAIDEVAVYDKILSADDLAAMYATAAYGTTTAPFIVAQPASQAAVAGSAATLTIVAQGSVPLAYQWSLNGTPVPGATRSALSFASVAYGNAGSYTVRISNSAGNTNSAAATLTVLPPPTFANLTNGLVLHLPFDSNYQDSSGHANDATTMGAPTIVAGKVGAGALRYSTTATEANYLVLPPSSDLYFGTDVNFSVGFWIKFTGLPGDLPFLCNNDYSYGGGGLTLAPSYNEGGWSWYISDASAGAWQGAGLYGPPNTINDGVWHHLLYTFDRAGYATVYRDGAMENQTSITNGNWWNIDTGRQLHIGQAAGAYTEVGTFDMDDFGIWRTVLTPYEALSIYNAGQNYSQSFNVYGPVKLDIVNAGANTIMAWQAGTLQSNEDITNPNGWVNVTGAAPPTYTVTPAPGRKFYRVRLN
jgi:hypothetical protein